MVLGVGTKERGDQKHFQYTLILNISMNCSTRGYQGISEEALQSYMTRVVDSDPSAVSVFMLSLYV